MSSSNTENLDDLLTAELVDTILDNKTTSLSTSNSTDVVDDNATNTNTNANTDANIDANTDDETSTNNEKNENNKNWLQKATSNVIQHAKNVKIGNNPNSSSSEEAVDDSVIVPTPITSMMDDTDNAQEQTLWGMSSTSPSTSPSSSSKANNDTTVSSYNNNSNQSKRPSLSYDNFTFSPPDNFVPISSCDELEPLPSTMLRDFKDKGQKSNGSKSDNNKNESLKLSSNFSKLFANTKKVDLVRKAHSKAARGKGGGKDPSKGKKIFGKRQGKDVIQTTTAKTTTTTPPMITSSKEADEYLAKNQIILQDSSTTATSATTTTNNDNNNEPTSPTNSNNPTNDISQQKAINGGVAAVASLSSISVHKAQQNLIEQLKQGLDFLTSQNKHLSSHGDALQQQIGNERKEFLKQLQEKQKEVEERNIKLAALEQHFMALNNLDSGSDGGAGGGGVTNTGDAEAGYGEKTTTEETSEAQSKSIKTSVSSSIVQIDKGYLNDLEKTVKLQKFALEKFEAENKTLKSDVSTYTEELTKKERTITNLESTLKQGREARFSKKSKTHRRRATEGVIISNTSKVSASMTNTPATLTPAQSDDDSASNTSSVNANNDNNKVDIEKAIATAVAEALTKQDKDHQSSMDVLSQQLDLKDKIIQRHEMKIYSLIHEKGGGEIKSPIRQRHVPQDVMIRNISVTNELMDTSIRKLEKMMEQLELVEKEKRTDLADEISPIRRVATKVSLVHEEMKVAIKLIEQKVTNDVERIKQSSSEGCDNDDDVVKNMNDESAAEDVKSGQTSGEGGDDNNNSNSSASSSQQKQSSSSKSSIDDQIAEVLTESMKALKETEASVKSQIDDLTEQLQKIEFELAGKQDTIEALELACSEHVQNCRKMQEEIEQLKLGMMQV